MLATPIIVSHKDDPEMTGIAVSMDIVLMPCEKTDLNPVGIGPKAMMGVCWDHQRCPAVSIHDPSELSWEDVPEVTDVIDEDGEDDGQDDSSGEDQ